MKKFSEVLASMEVWIPLDKIYNSLVADEEMLEDGPASYSWSFSEDGEAGFQEEDNYFAGMVEVLLEGGTLPPILVTPLTPEVIKSHLGNRSTQGCDYLLLDGHHRYFAHLYAEHEEINATIADWDESAQEYLEVPDEATTEYVEFED